MAAARLEIEIQRAARSAEAPCDADLRTWIGLALGGAAGGELTLRIVDEAESAELNERYRGQSGPTNVLSFAGGESAPAGLDAGADESWPIGDLVVCAPVVAREAREQRKAATAHWAHIVIHGCLHLLGYDHALDADAEVMEQRERELLAELGIADPYRAPAG